MVNFNRNYEIKAKLSLGITEAYCGTKGPLFQIHYGQSFWNDILIKHFSNIKVGFDSVIQFIRGTFTKGFNCSACIYT